MTPVRPFLFWFGALALACVVIYLLRSILLPFVAGFAVAYLFDPVADWLERRGINRSVAALAAMLLFFLAVLAVMLLIVPVLQGQVADLAGRIPQLVELLRERLLPDILSALDRSGFNVGAELQKAATAFGRDILGIVGSLIGGALSGGAALLNLLSLLFITPIVAFYLLRDWDRMVADIDEWVPRRNVEEVRAIARDIDRVLGSFVRGQGTICLLLGTFYALALALAGLDFALIIGILIGFISFIPFVGAIVGGSLSILLAVAQFWPDYMHIGLVAGIFVLGQVIEGNVLQPKLLGDSVGLHPVWVMFALLAGGVLFGFVGILLAVPVAAAAGVLVRHLHDRYLMSHLYRDAEPAPGGDGAVP